MIYNIGIDILYIIANIVTFGHTFNKLYIFIFT